jgi:acetolactate synthase-1/2/3 large subunit
MPKIESGTVADAYLTLLADRGIEYLFANAGTDFAPLIEAFAKGQLTGAKYPKPITVPHENVAMAMAQGFYLKSGRPQAVMVHVNAGTANAIAGLINAWRGNVPIFFTAGRTPFTEDGGVLGQRSGEIHWTQEMRDQRAITREFVKWDYELPNGHVVEAAVDRALNIMMSEPRGPIYMTLPRETLASSITNFEYDSPSRHSTPTAPYPDLNAIDKAADWLAQAEHPLIVTSSAGRDPEDVARIARLAESFALPVIQRKPRYVALSSEHPMHLGFDPDPWYDFADVIVVLECDVPWIPKKKSPKPSAKIIHLGSDPIFENYPLRGYRSDLAITGVPSATLPLLAEALEIRAKGAETRVAARRDAFAKRRAAQQEKARAALEDARNASPIRTSWVTHCLDQVRGPSDVIVKESPIAPELLRLTEPGTFFSVGAGGALGWSLGTSLGIKAAAPDRVVICTVGDGAYMFGNPVPAHYVSHAEKLPILTVIFNNQMWGAVKRNTREVYPDGYAAKSNREPLTYFETGMRFEKAVEIVGGYGERVEEPAEVPKAIDRALNAIGEGRPATLNVVCRGP